MKINKISKNKINKINRKMIGKFGLALGLWSLCLVMLGGCGEEQKQEGKGGTEESGSEGRFGKRVGSKVPEAFQDSGEGEEEQDLKAKGFVYEEENMEYQLVWSDEFDYEGLPDENKWSYDVGGSGWGNNELQYYTNGGNVQVKDGKLAIELRKEEMNGDEYTSARLVTKGKGDWIYGKIEVRAKLPKGLGTWPAIWMLPTDNAYGTWPASGELDIMEHVGYDQGNINGTIHTQSYNHSIGTQKSGIVKIEDAGEEFHIYGMEWLPDKVKISADGEVYFTFDPISYKSASTYKEWPFDQRMHLLLNVAFGGNWGGSRGVDDSVLPVQMEVDYVRIYQSPQVSRLDKESSSPEVWKPDANKLSNGKSPLLAADGKVLRNDAGTGDVVQLKGTNVGGYLIQELWMTGTEAAGKVKDQTSIEEVLTERFGEDKAGELIRIYQENYFTAADFNYCKELGMNCLRLPFWYRDIVEEDGSLKSDWSERLDWFLEEAARREMYVILDCHGAPGSQNGSDHSGKDGGNAKEAASEFFFGDKAAANQEIFYRMWEAIAAKYKDNPWVAGYDLMNEPYCTYRYNSSKTEGQLHEKLWMIYNTAYDRIRKLDPEHVILMEATWDPRDLPDPDKYGWSNVMYQYHNYLYDDYDNKDGRQISNMETKLDAIAQMDYDVPGLLGEFSYFNNLKAWEEGMQFVNNSGISWTTWTYKVTGQNNNWGLKNQKDRKLNLETASYEEIRDAWGKSGEAEENPGLREVMEKYFKRVDIGAK